MVPDIRQKPERMRRLKRQQISGLEPTHLGQQHRLVQGIPHGAQQNIGTQGNGIMIGNRPCEIEQTTRRIIAGAGRQLVDVTSVLQRLENVVAARRWNFQQTRDVRKRERSLLVGEKLEEIQGSLNDF